MQFNLFGNKSESYNLENVSKVPGLKLIPEFISQEEEADLLRTIDQQDWLTDLSRRVQHYGYKYDYRARRIDEGMRLGPLPEWAVRIGEKLVQGDFFESLPDQMIVNEYLPGQGISPHIDCEPCFGPVIASLSLGSSAIMEFSIAYPAKKKVSLLLEPRSLVILSGPAREIWQHAIPARKKDRYGESVFLRSRRVSITFRKVI